MALVFPNIQLDDVIRGDEFKFKASASAASNANTNWTTTATAAYSSPTLTLSNLNLSVGTIGQLDGWDNLVIGDRILLKDMATISGGAAANASFNGIWQVTGGTTTSITAIRPFDYQEGDATPNINIWVTNGTTWARTGFVCTSATTVQSGTSPAGNTTWTQYDVTQTLATTRGGTGVTTFGGTNTILYTTSASTLASITAAANSVLITSAGSVPSLSTTLPTAVQNNITHGNLSGLLADDHTQYALLAGRGTGQTLIGGTAAGNNLTLQSTSNASRGSVISNDPFKANTIDAATATTLSIGATTATEVRIGSSTARAHVLGDLVVDGTTTTVHSQHVDVADNYFYMNADYTTVAAKTGGLAINYLPTATTTTVASGGFATTSTVITTGSATFAANDIIQITGANTLENNGVFEVSSHIGTTLTIKTSPTEDFSQNIFVVDTTVAGTITKVNVSIIRTNTSGAWQMGKGATTPITYSSIATTSHNWSFELISAQIAVSATAYTTVGYFPWRATTYNPSSSTTTTLIAWIDTGANRNTDLQIFDGTSQIGIISVTAGTAAGIFTGSVTSPTTDVRLEVRVRKSAAGGTNPNIYGVNFEMTS
jgi:hypothetical protein